MYSALDVAKYIIQLGDSTKYPITNSRLNAILYFTQAAFLCDKNEPCFHEGIEAWYHGPVVRDVYHRYSIFCNNRIMQFSTDRLCIGKYDQNIIKSVVRKCDAYDTKELLAITRCQEPWINARSRRGFVIDNAWLKKFFNEEV